MALPSSGPVGGPEAGADLGPGLLPAVGTDDGAEGEQWIDVLWVPVHPAALEAVLDDDLIGALDNAAADRIAGRAEGRVLELREPWLRVGQGGVAVCARRQRPQGGQDRVRPVMLEGVGPL